MRKEYLIGIGVIVIIAALIVAGTTARKYRDRTQEAERIADISNSKSPQTIDDLRKTIAAYEKQLDQFLKASAKSGTYWKILASRLQSQREPQHGEALKALQNAIQYNPEDESLYYMTGVSAEVMARASLDFPNNPPEQNRDAYYKLAEQSYLRAIELNGQYDKPLYALGVLYVFALGRADEAVPYILRYMDLNTRNPEGTADALFALGGAYYALRDFLKAADQYGLIITTSKNKTKQERASELRQLALEAQGR
jgi:gas vesicle protein